MNPRHALSLLARLLVGGVLVYAAYSKAGTPTEEFAYVIQNYGLVPNDMALPLAGFLPWFELALGWALILGAFGRLAVGGAMALFAMFVLALGSVIARGIPLHNCGCFSGALHFSPPQTLVMDLIALGLLFWVLKHGHGPLSLDSWSERGL